MGVAVLTRADHHEIRITGMDRVWGLRTSVTIPFSLLDEVRVMTVGEATRGVWLRTGGLAFPRRARVGHFRGRPRKRQYWRWWGSPRVVVIDLKSGGRFDRVVLDVDDPETTAQQLRLPLVPHPQGR